MIKLEYLTSINFTSSISYQYYRRKDDPNSLVRNITDAINQGSLSALKPADLQNLENNISHVVRDFKIESNTTLCSLAQKVHQQYSQKLEVCKTQTQAFIATHPKLSKHQYPTLNELLVDIPPHLLGSIKFVKVSDTEWGVAPYDGETQALAEEFYACFDFGAKNAEKAQEVVKKLLSPEDFAAFQQQYQWESRKGGKDLIMDKPDPIREFRGLKYISNERGRIKNKKLLIGYLKKSGAIPYPWGQGVDDKVGEYIHKLGITDQAALVELATIAAKTYGSDLAKNIKNYGIKDPKARLAIAEILAKSRALTNEINDFGITDQEALVKLAKLSATLPGGHLPEYIDSYGITNPDHLYDIAVMCAQTRGSKLPQFISKFGITDPNKLFNLAKIAAGTPYSSFARHINNFGITDPAKLLELAKIAAQTEGCNLGEYIELFKVTKQEDLDELARLASKTHGSNLAEHIEKFHIDDKTLLLEIAKNLAAIPDSQLCKNIKKFKIEKLEDRVKVAEIAARTGNSNLGSYIQDFDITDPAVLLRIGKLAAPIGPSEVLNNLEKFHIKEQKDLIEVAEDIFKAHPDIFVQNAIALSFQDQAVAIRFAKRAAVIPNSGLSANLMRFGIQDRKALIEIGELCAETKGSGSAINIASNLQRVGLSDMNILQLFILIADARTPSDSSYLISPKYNDLYNPLECRPSYTAFCDITSALRIRQQHHHPMKEFHEIVEAAFKDIDEMEKKSKKDETYVREKLFRWALDFVGHDLNPATSADLVKNEIHLVEDISRYRDPEMRLTLNHIFFREFKGDWRGFWGDISEIDPTRKRGLITALLLSRTDPKFHGVGRLLLDAFYKNKHTEREKGKIKVLNNFIYQINSCDLASTDFLFNFIDKAITPRLASKNKENTDLAMQAIRTLASMLKVGHGKYFENIQTLEDLGNGLTELFKKEIGVEGVTNLDEKYDHTLGTFRHIEAFFTYAAGLKRLGRYKDLENYKKFIKGVLNDTFTKDRYENEHLKTIFSTYPQLKEVWRRNSEKNAEVMSLDSADVQEKNYTDEMRDLIFTQQHLGPDFATKYPDLIKFLTSGELPTDETTPFQEAAIHFLHNVNDQPPLPLLERMLRLTPPNELFFKDVKAWYELLEGKEQKPTPSSVIEDKGVDKDLIRLKVIETDDPREMFAMGDEVLASCQETSGDPEKNRGLLGYLLNGQNKLVAVTDEQGKIIGRSLIRLLWDKENKRPVLYQEKYYQSNPNPKIESLVRAKCIEKAREMGVVLVGANGDSDYMGELSNLAGEADEYVDAIGGIHQLPFTIPSNKIIYEPPHLL